MRQWTPVSRLGALARHVPSGSVGRALSDDLHPETLCVEAGDRSAAGDPVSPALYLSTTYRHGGDHEYIRDGSPTTEAFERVVGSLEGGHAAAFASGMAASAGGPRRRSRRAPGCSPRTSPTPACARCSSSAPRSGALEVEFVDQTDTEAAIAAIDGAALVWAESPNNPLLEITDIAALAAAAHERGALLAVDATLATPLLQDSLGLGADFVVHSATKYIAGHSDSLLGVVVGPRGRGRRDADRTPRAHRRRAGPVRDLPRPARDPHPGAAGRAQLGERRPSSPAGCASTRPSRGSATRASTTTPATSSPPGR